MKRLIFTLLGVLTLSVVSAVAQQHGGWVHRGATDTTFIHCPTDSMDWLAFPPGCIMGMMYPDSIYAWFEEMHPDSLPGPHEPMIIGGYYCDIADPQGQGMMGGGMMGFQQSIGLHLHYGPGGGSNKQGSEDDILLKHWDAASAQWVEVSGTTVDPAENTVVAIQNPLRSHYALFTSSVPSKGDVNGDGTVDVLDIVRAVNIILGLGSAPTEEEFWAADCNEDGDLNVLDLVGIVNVILGYGTCPPAGNAKIAPAVIEYLESLRPYFAPEDFARLTALLKEAQVPVEYTLSQNYPNPFNPVTTIQYSVISDQSPPHVTLKIYNLLGQEVRTLVDGSKDAGYYTVRWDGRDSFGQEVSSGVYFYQIRARDFTAVKRMMLLK